MAGLTSKTIASTYNSLLRTLADGGITTSLQIVEDGAGDDTCLQLSTKQFLVKSATDIDATFDVKNSSGHQLLTIDTASTPEEVVVNEGGLGTVDFRVEGSGAANALFVDGTNGFVSIGTATAVAEGLTVTGAPTAAYLGIFEAQCGDVSTNCLGLVIDNDADQGHVLHCRRTDDGTWGGASPVELFEVTYDGKVGIGTSTPVNTLHVAHNIADGDNGIMIVNEQTTITDGELLGAIGFDGADGAIPSSCLEAACFIAAYAAEDHGTSDKGGDLAFGCSLIDESEDVVSTEHMRILDSGKVGIGTSAPTSRLFVECPSAETAGQFAAVVKNASNDNASMHGLMIITTNTGADMMKATSPSGDFYIKADGDCENSYNRYDGLSDRRLKENIVDATPKLDDLNKLKIRNWNFIEGVGDGRKSIGVIADEAMEVFPSLVTVKDDRIYDDDGNYISGYEDRKGFGYSILVPILVKALQELSAKVTALENA